MRELLPSVPVDVSYFSWFIAIHPPTDTSCHRPLLKWGRLPPDESPGHIPPPYHHLGEERRDCPLKLILNLSPYFSPQPSVQLSPSV